MKHSASSCTTTVMKFGCQITTQAIECAVAELRSVKRQVIWLFTKADTLKTELNTGMFFGIITLLTALTIAGVAAWFSIAGLMAIFSASASAIAIMAGSLEVGKLLTASWLYRYWDETSIWMKSYLTIAVLALMLITSMGIFGYLSKAHLDQAAVSGDAIAVVERVDGKIQRQRDFIALTEERIASINSGGGLDVTQSITQQETIRDGAWERVQGDIEYNQGQITSIRSQLQKDLDGVDTQLQSDLQSGNDRLKALDAIVESYTSQGTTTNETSTGGIFSGTQTETVDNVAKGAEVRESQQTERAEIAQQQQDLRDRADKKKNELRQIANSEIAGLQSNIDRYRAQAQETVDAANREINRLRDSATQDQDADFERVEQLNAEIDTAYETIAELNAEKFEAEREVRVLEQEVGPIKYVAELVYGDQSQELLDKAVRLFILLLVFVFDPLAVMLVIAANQTLLRYGINLESAGPQPGDKDAINHDETDEESTDIPNDENQDQDLGRLQDLEKENAELLARARSLEEEVLQKDRELDSGGTERIVEVEGPERVVEVAGPERVVEVTKSEEVQLGDNSLIEQLEKRIEERLNKDG